MHSYSTIHQLTCLGTSQQNGRSEWKLHHILDIIRALLLSTKVLTPFWDEASLHVIHTINRIPNPVIQNQTPYEHFFRSPPEYQHLRSFGFACFIFLQSHEHNRFKPQSRLRYFLGYVKLKRGTGVMILSLTVFVSLTMLSFGNTATLSSSLTSVPPYLPPSVLNLFLDEPNIHSIIAPNPPIEFFVQPSDIFYASPRSPSNEQVEDEQIEDKLPNFEPGSLTLAPLEDLAQYTSSLNLGKIYFCIYLTIIVTLPLLLYISLTPIVRPPLILYGRLQWKRNLMHYPKIILGIWWLSPLGSLWLVVSESTRPRLGLMAPLCAAKLVLLQKVLHRSMWLIIKRPLLRLLESYLFVPF